MMIDAFFAVIWSVLAVLGVVRSLSVLGIVGVVDPVLIGLRDISPQHRGRPAPYLGWAEITTLCLLSPLSMLSLLCLLMGMLSLRLLGPEKLVPQVDLMLTLLDHFAELVLELLADFGFELLLHLLGVVDLLELRLSRLERFIELPNASRHSVQRLEEVDVLLCLVLHLDLVELAVLQIHHFCNGLKVVLLETVVQMLMVGIPSNIRPLLALIQRRHEEVLLTFMLMVAID